MNTFATEIDFHELTRLISREIGSALRISSISKDTKKRIHVSRIKVKLGRVSPPGSDPQKHGKPREGSGGEPPKPFLLLEHYPAAKQGWVFEMEFSAGPAPPRARQTGGVWQIVPMETIPTLSMLFRNMPIRAIKGVSKAWAKKLDFLGVSTIGALISLEHRDLIEISRKTNSRYPLELFAKSQLLRVWVPEIPKSAADEHSLFELLGRSEAELRKLIGTKRFSATAGEQLHQLLCFLNVVIDARWLRRIYVKDLRNLPKSVGASHGKRR